MPWVIAFAVATSSATYTHAAPREHRFDLSLGVAPMYKSDTTVEGSTDGGVSDALHLATRAGYAYLPAGSVFTIGFVARHAWTDDRDHEIALMGLVGLTVFRGRRVDATLSTALGPSLERLSRREDIGSGFTWEMLRVEPTWWVRPAFALRWHVAAVVDQHGYDWSGRSASTLSSALLVGFGIATRI